MKLSNTATIANYEITETLDVITGSYVQSKHIGRDIMAGLKSIVGGEIEGYTEKMMNLFLKEKINPLIGAAGVSAVPDSARVVHHFALQYDKTNHLLMHAMAPNVAGVIGSAIAAGVFISIYAG